MPVTAKICGLSTPETLDAAIAGGASHVGFVFFAPSPRNVDFDQARGLIQRVPAHVGTVGVFVDPDEALLAAALATGIQAAQLHKTAPDRAAAIRMRVPIWAAVAVKTRADIAQAVAYRGAADRILYDAKTPDNAALPGGMGLRFDWKLLENIPQPLPWALSGGLDAGNVREAARVTGAKLVDVYPWNFLPPLFLGLILGVLAVRTNSTVAAMISHAATNATAFTVSLSLDEQHETATYVLIGLLSLAFVVIFPAFLARTAGVIPRMPLLSVVPAGVSRAVKWAVVCGMALFVTTLATATYALIGVQVMSSDDLEPEIHRGDRLILLKSRFVDPGFKPGDIVAYSREGMPLARRVTHCDDQGLWVSDGSSEELVARQDLRGKVIHKIETD